MLRLLYCCLIILLLPVQVIAQSISINVHEQSTVSGSVITLGELADIEGADDVQAALLSQLQLGSAPLPGNSVTLTPELLGMRLAATGFDFNGINWHVPANVKITAEAQNVVGKWLAEEAVAYLKQRIGNEDITISLVGNQSDVVVPVGDIKLLFNLPSGVRYNGATVVNADIVVAGKVAARQSLRFDINLYKRVVVSSRSINSRQVLAEDDVRYARVEVGRLRAGYLTDIKDAEGLMARRPIVPGSVISGELLVKPIIIRRGEPVAIIARIGSIEVSAVGKALQDGCEGQLIRVQNTGSNKIMVAKVAGEAAVEVLSSR